MTRRVFAAATILIFAVLLAPGETPARSAGFAGGRSFAHPGPVRFAAPPFAPVRRPPVMHPRGLTRHYPVWPGYPWRYRNFAGYAGYALPYGGFVYGPDIAWTDGGAPPPSAEAGAPAPVVLPPPPRRDCTTETRTVPSEAGGTRQISILRC